MGNISENDSRIAVANNQDGQGGKETRRSYVKRLGDLLDGSAIIKLVLGLAAIAGAITYLVKPVIGLVDRASWREGEVSKISEVAIERSLESMVNDFGPPDRKLSFQGSDIRVWTERGYEIRATIVNAAVESYLVHVCDRDLKPRLTTGAQSGTNDYAIEPNVQSLSEVAKSPAYVAYNWAPAFMVYWEGIEGSHADSWRDRYYGAWSCGGDQGLEWRGSAEYPTPFNCARHAHVDEECMAPLSRPVSFDSQEIAELRRGLVINAFGEAHLESGFPPPEIMSIPPSEL